MSKQTFEDIVADRHWTDNRRRYLAERFILDEGLWPKFVRHAIEVAELERSQDEGDPDE